MELSSLINFLPGHISHIVIVYHAQSPDYEKDYQLLLKVEIYTIFNHYYYFCIPFAGILTNSFVWKSRQHMERHLLVISCPKDTVARYLCTTCRTRTNIYVLGPEVNSPGWEPNAGQSSCANSHKIFLHCKYQCPLKAFKTIYKSPLLQLNCPNINKLVRSALCQWVIPSFNYGFLHKGRKGRQKLSTLLSCHTNII